MLRFKRGNLRVKCKRLQSHAGSCSQRSVSCQKYKLSNVAVRSSTHGGVGFVNLYQKTTGDSCQVDMIQLIISIVHLNIQFRCLEVKISVHFELSALS